MPKRDPRLEGMSIRDPRLLRRENLMPYRPQLLSLSPPREQRQSERPQERHLTPPREPGVKRGLLKTPPHSMRLQHPSYGGGAGVSQNFKEERTPKKGLLKTPPDHMRLLPPLKHDSDGPSDPDDDPPPKKTRTLDMKSTIKFSPEENERETDNSSEDEHAHNTAGHKKRMLPPATSVTKYEARSPLDQQDEEPRKTYDSAKMSASSSRDRLLSTICSWNPKWILIPEKSKNFPDLLNNEEKYMSKKDLVQFSSSHAYCKHFQDGLFLDLWSNLCKIVLQARKKGRVLITAEVEGEPQELPLLGNIKRRTIICHCGTANNDENKIFKKNDVVIVHSGKYLYFAYVVAEPKTKCISDKVELPNYLRKDRHGKTFTHKCTFPLMVVVPIDNSVDPGKLIYIEKVKNISDDLETMKSLETFSTLSSLSTLVMQPIYYPSMKTVVAKYEALLDRELRPSLLSLIQDIKGNEAPSINVIEGGPGTGKSHLAAVLAKELSSPENYVILTSKSIHELNTLAKLLCGSKLKVEDSKENNAVDAVWCGSKRSRAEWDSLEKISFDTLVKKSDSKTDNTIYRLNEKKEILKKAIHKEEIAICKLIACGKSAEAASLKTSCAKKKMDLSLKESEIEEASKPVLKKSPNPSEILQKCNIILTTFSPPLYCLEAFKNMQRQCRRVVLIVDNASEVVEPIIIRLIRAFNVSDLVLFGDTKQHVPFVPSERARNSGLDVSLMERYSRALRDTEFPPKSRLLTRQFRLHPHVMSPINNHFYNNTMSEIDQKIRTHAFQPYIWFHCSYFSQGEERFRQEADFAEKLLSVVCKIPPYSSDDQKIRSYHVQVTSLCPNVSKILSSSSKSHLPFTPSNLLSSLEFDVLILCVGSATRVAAHKIITPWTRAKRSLFVCGSFDHQSVRGPMTHLLRRAQEKGYLKEITSAQITEEKLEEKIKKY
ncbi:uncharacterized protein LOC113207788 [Frankliniella occidentalis]|uniref:Uncharacterized protein LOC113207788 n=1 Tax=Frankliniella occidentalis TaxID=133901 RepID=A0A9C6TVN9_FRAOC|nr:uncharacterized protein LOC113207788 [Frankliniella occidentalis]